MIGWAHFATEFSSTAMAHNEYLINMLTNVPRGTVAAEDEQRKDGAMEDRRKTFRATERQRGV